MPGNPAALVLQARDAEPHPAVVGNNGRAGDSAAVSRNIDDAGRRLTGSLAHRRFEVQRSPVGAPAFGSIFSGFGHGVGSSAHCAGAMVNKWLARSTNWGAAHIGG